MPRDLDWTRARALTVWQPYAWAIAQGHKPVENRGWRPPDDAIGSPLLIHAAARKVTLDEVGDVESCGLVVPDDLPLGAVVAVTIPVGVCTDDPEGLLHLSYHTGREHEPRLGLVGPTCAGFDPGYIAWGSVADWYSGPRGWLLCETVALPRPVPATGRQRLWTPPPDVLAEVRRQYEEAGRG